jgi:glutamate/tyrosine decarboxylase-like PLP-dependent enzyme
MLLASCQGMMAGRAARAALSSSRASIRPPPHRCRRRPAREALASSSAREAATTATPTEPPLPPDFAHPMSAEEFRRAGHAAIDYVADYYARLEASADADAEANPPPPLIPVTPPSDRFPPGFLRRLLPAHAPEHPEPWDAIMRDYRDLIEPGLTHWQHPGFMAYFPGATSRPGVLSEVLIAATNTIGFSWAASPAATELERVATDWLARLCGLPSRFLYEDDDRAGGGGSAGGEGGGASPSVRTGGGSIQGTTSEAVLVAVLAARARVMRDRPPEDALRLVAYGTDQAHSCFAKAARIAIPEGHARVLTCRKKDAFALDPEALREAVRRDLQDGLLPFFAMATIGTTSSCAVDPAAEMAAVLREETERFFSDSGNGSNGNGAPSFPGVWLHVDAAYAGAFAVLPELRARYFSSAWEAADSYSYNPHKAGLVTFDCCAMWAADCGAVRDALALTPVFLKARANELDFKDLQIPLGRRFRALKLWAVLRAYGAEGIRAHARHHCAVASWLARRVDEDGRFEQAAVPRFGLVCFRLLGGDGRDRDEAALRRLNERLLARVNASGRAFIIHTVLEDRFVLRAAVGALTQQPRHVESFWRLVQREAEEVLREEA